VSTTGLFEEETLFPSFGFLKIWPLKTVNAKINAEIIQKPAVQAEEIIAILAELLLCFGAGFLVVLAAGAAFLAAGAAAGAGCAFGFGAGCGTAAISP
jgi:hypothetical protein